jgi:translation initiation factor 2 subunit 2
MTEEESQQQQVEAATEDGAFDPSLKKKKKSSKKKTTEDAEVAEATDMMSELGTKKKKKKKEKPEFVEEGGEEEGESTPTAEGGEFEFKKKKKKSKSAATSAFEQELQEAGVSEKKKSASEEAKRPQGVNEDGEPDLTYADLLDRFFSVLRENNPDLAGDRTGVKYKIPPPSVGREGNKKSLFSNVKEISDRMHRPTEHVIQFLFAELGTSGSVDGSNRLVIKGRFQQKQIETVLRRYIVEYVTCKTCKSVNTTLTKENRLYFLICNSCGSRRSVQSIKTGYQAIIRRRDLRKKQV